MPEPQTEQQEIIRITKKGTQRFNSVEELRAQERKENEAYFKKQQIRKIGRRVAYGALGAATVAGAITTGYLATHPDSPIIDSKAREQISTRTTVAQVEKGTEQDSVGTQEGIPERFLPGNTYVDLTKINIRTYADVNNEEDVRNTIPLQELGEIENELLTGKEKTLIVKDGRLKLGTDGNYYIVLSSKLKNGKSQDVFLNYDETKGTAIFADADKTDESGFIDEDTSGKVEGVIPRFRAESTIVPIGEMNKVSFSNSPISEFISTATK